MTRHHLTSFLALTLICGGFSSAHAEDAPKKEESVWMNDADAALARAVAEKKDVVMFITENGCGCCVALKKKILDSEEFKKGMSAHYVLAEVNVDKSKGNKAWGKKFGVEGFPKTFLTDDQGRPYFAFEGYEPKSLPKSYLDRIEKAWQCRVTRDEKWSAAEKVQGVEKVKLLDEGLTVIASASLEFGEDYAVKYYGSVLDQVIQLDPGGKFKAHCEKLRKGSETKAAMMGFFVKEIAPIMKNVKEKPKETIQTLRDLAAKDGLAHELKQITLLVALNVSIEQLKDRALGEQLWDEAIAADPESKYAVAMKDKKAMMFAAFEKQADKVKSTPQQP